MSGETIQNKTANVKASTLSDLFAQWEAATAPFKNVEWVPKDGDGKLLICMRKRS